jgi:hypothetical protein
MFWIFKMVPRKILVFPFSLEQTFFVTEDLAGKTAKYSSVNGNTLYTWIKKSRQVNPSANKGFAGNHSYEELKRFRWKTLN